MEKRYLSKESVNDFDFDKKESFSDCYKDAFIFGNEPWGYHKANIFEKKVSKDGRKYIEVGLVYANEGLLKILFNEYNKIRLNKWYKRVAHEIEYSNWDTEPRIKLTDDAIIRYIVTDEPYNIYLRCYEDGEVTISFVETYIYIIQGGTFRLVGDGVPLLLDKVKRYAKMNGLNFRFNKKL